MNQEWDQDFGPSQKEHEPAIESRLTRLLGYFSNSLLMNVNEWKFELILVYAPENIEGKQFVENW